MKVKFSAALSAALVVLFSLCSTPVSAQVPPLPHAFYGTLKINGSPAPVGTQVEARGEGVDLGYEGNPVITTETGKYGGAGQLEPKLIVQGFISDGTDLTFYVNGVAANQTAKWYSGEFTELNLTATITVAPPVVATDLATSVGTNAATLQGTLTGLGSASSVQVSFEWGTSTSYGSETGVQVMNSTGSFSAPLSGLAASTTYHFRAKAVGASTNYGADRTFTTGSSSTGGGGGGGGGAGIVSYCKYVQAYATASGKFIKDIYITSKDNNVRLDIAKDTIGLIHGDSLYTICIDVMLDPPDVPQDRLLIGSIYDISPDDATFNPAITMTITFDPDSIPAGTSIEDLVIAVWNEDTGEWEDLEGTTVDLANNSVSVPVSHFTAFAIMYHKTTAAPASFTTSNLSISPANVEPGETVTMSVLVTNTSDLAGSYDVILKVNDVIEDTVEVNLEGGASRTVTFTTVKDAAGTYTVNINNLAGAFTVNVPEIVTAPTTEEPTTTEEETTTPVSDEPAGNGPEEAEATTEPFNWYLIGGIIGGVAVVLLLFFGLSRRRA